MSAIERHVVSSSRSVCAGSGISLAVGRILNYCFHMLNSKYRESKDETVTYNPARLVNVSGLVVRWSCAQRCQHEKLRY